MDNEKINSELDEVQEDVNIDEYEENSEEIQEELQDGYDPSIEDSSGSEEQELSENKKKKTLLTLLEYVELFAIAMFAVLFFFSFIFKICVVDGDSMNNTLRGGEKLITTNMFYTPKTEDIIVFYEDNGDDLQKPLVKRVIATEGQTLEINYYKGTVKVDGQLLDEDYAYIAGGSYIIKPDYTYDMETGIMKLTIPEDMLFVMGDNRNNSWDSRSDQIGCISESQIMGKVVFRISPPQIFN